MAVELTESEIKLFNQNGIKTADIQETVNNYRADGLSDDAIRAKVDAKLNNWNKPDNTTLKGGISKNANWDKKGNVYYTDENGNKIDTGLNPLQKLGRKAKSIADNTLSTINSTTPEAFKQKAEAAAAALTLPLGGSAALTGKLASKLAPVAGKKIAQGIASGTLSGGISGGAYGALNGITNGITDEKSAIDTLKQSGLSALGYGGLGALTGGTLGLAGGKIMQGINANRLKNAQFDNLTGEDIKNLRNLAKEYYNDFIKGTNIKRKDIGAIQFNNKGIDEQVSKGLHNANIIPDFKKQIKTGTKEPLPRKDYARDDIKQFHIINNKNNGKDIEYQIAEDINGNKYYFAKDVTNSKTPHSTYRNQNPGSNEVYSFEPVATNTNSITNSPENFNPDKTALNNFKNYIESQKYLTGKLDVYRGRYKNRFFSKRMDTPDNDIELASRQFNEILDKIKKNPEILENTEEITKIEKEIEKMPAPLDFQEEMYKKFYDIYAQSFPMLSKEFKQSRLPKGANLPEEIKKAVKKNPPEYEVLHNKDLINEARSTIVNDAELSQKLLNKAVSGGKNNEFSALEFEQARQLIDKLYQEGKNEEALNLTRLVSEAGSRAGQAVQAMSLWKRTTPAGAVKNAQHIIDEYNKTVKNPDKQIKLTDKNIEEIKKLTENIHKAPEGREKDIATSLLLKYEKELVPSSAANKIKTLRNISLLLNPRTFMRNLSGNAIFGAIDNLVSKPLAAGIDKLISPITGKRTRTLPKLDTYFKGMTKGLKEGSEDVSKGINTRDKIGQRFDIQRKSFDKGILGGLETALNWSLQVPDRMFYQAAFNESLANQMTAAGVKEATNDMLKRAEAEALEAVFQNNGALSDTVLGLRNGLNRIGYKNFGLGDTVIPFAQTPANITQQGVNYSPLGLLKAAGNAAKGDQRQAALDTARALTGTGIGTAGYQAAKNGLIALLDDEDYKGKQNYTSAGIKPYTLKTPNGTRISLSQLQPLSQPLIAGAALNDMAQGNYTRGLNASLGALLETSYLQTISQIAKDIANEDYASAMLDPMAQLPSQFVPTGLNQINAFVDPNQRVTKDENPAKQAYNRLISKIPFASKTLPLKYDVEGNPAKKYDRKGIAGAFDILANPTYVNKEKDSPELKEVLRLYKQTGDKGILYNVPPKNITFTDATGEKQKIKLDGKQYSEYQRISGEKSNKLLKALISSPVYQNAEDKVKAEFIKAAHEEVKNRTNEELLNKPTKEQAKVSRKIRNKIKKLSKTPQENVQETILKKYKSAIQDIDF